MKVCLCILTKEFKELWRGLTVPNVVDLASDLENGMSLSL